MIGLAARSTPFRVAAAVRFRLHFAPLRFWSAGPTRRTLSRPVFCAAPLLRSPSLTAPRLTGPSSRLAVNPIPLLLLQFCCSRRTTPRQPFRASSRCFSPIFLCVPPHLGVWLFAACFRLPFDSVAILHAAPPLVGFSIRYRARCSRRPPRSPFSWCAFPGCCRDAVCCGLLPVLCYHFSSRLSSLRYSAHLCTSGGVIVVPPMGIRSVFLPCFHRTFPSMLLVPRFMVLFIVGLSPRFSASWPFSPLQVLTTCTCRRFFPWVDPALGWSRSHPCLAYLSSRL